MSKQITILNIDSRDVAQHLDLKSFREMGFLSETLDSYTSAQALLRAADKQEAVEIIAALAIKENIDLIIINLDTDVVDALHLMHQFRRRASTADILLVATSVQTEGMPEKRVLEAGADLFVLQPLPRKSFIKKIRALLKQQSRADERIKIAGRAEFVWENARYQCGIANISRSGVLLATRIHFEKGTVVNMSLFLAKARQPLVIEGEFVRVATQKDKGIGVKFTVLSAQQATTLNHFIAQHSDEALEMVYY